MRVLYWNCTSPGIGGDSFAAAKKAFIGSVVQYYAPDVLCLDEVSTGIYDLATASAYATNHLNGPYGDFTPQSAVVNPGVHLNTVSWVKDGGECRKFRTDIGVPSGDWTSDGTKRDLTRWQVRLGEKDVNVWFIHANASTSNGKYAAALAAKSATATRNVFIGDFNCPVQAAPLAVAPVVADHNFTQWKKDAHGSATVPGHLPPMKFIPHDMIDFAIGDERLVRIKPIDSVSPFDLVNFIGNMDHFPVVFDIFPV